MNLWQFLTKGARSKVTCSVISVLVGAALGPGFIWSRSTQQRENLRLELDKTKAVVEHSDELIRTYDQILLLADKYIAAQANSQGPDDPQFLKIAEEINFKYQTKKEAYTRIEEELAKIQGREPRPLKLDFIPPAPIKILNVRIVPEK